MSSLVRELRTNLLLRPTIRGESSSRESRDAKTNDSLTSRDTPNNAQLRLGAATSAEALDCTRRLRESDIDDVTSGIAERPGVGHRHKEVKWQELSLESDHKRPIRCSKPPGGSLHTAVK